MASSNCSVVLRDGHPPRVSRPDQSKPPEGIEEEGVFVVAVTRFEDCANARGRRSALERVARREVTVAHALRDEVLAEGREEVLEFVEIGKCGRQILQLGDEVSSYCLVPARTRASTASALGGALSTALGSCPSRSRRWATNSKYFQYRSRLASAASPARSRARVTS